MMETLLSQAPSWQNLLIFLLLGAALLMIVLGFVTYAILAERKVLGYMQLRVGPNRLGGRFGLLQTVADVAKLLMKEDIIPQKADKPLFVLAPVLAFVPAFAVLAVIPFSDSLYFADLGVGLLYYFAVAGISTLGIVTGAWASNNKYSLLGGMRAAAQMISYEIPLIMSVIGVVMLAGSINMNTIVEGQETWWYIFIQPLGFVIFIMAAVAELGRVPFDLPESESELVAGYMTEYSGFRWAFFMLAEYVYLFGTSALTTILFLGGWQAPLQFIPGLSFLEAVPGVIWFALKFMAVVFFMIWLRGTLPRVRADQLMEFGWKVLLPLSLVNIFLTALFIEIFIK